MRMFSHRTMRIIKSQIIIVFAILGFISCTLNGPDLTEALDDARTLQDMIPAFTGTLTVCDAESKGRTFDPSYSDDAPDGSPQNYWDLYNNGSVAICPSSGYFNDFYGETGTQAKLELTPDGEGFYHVKLLLFPALSLSVFYELEEYRVAAGSWIIVDDLGEEQPLAYDKLETVYFDRRKEERTIVRNTVSDDLTYDVGSGSVFIMPEDFSDPAFDFPDEITEPQTVIASGEDYSCWVESEIPPVFLFFRLASDITEFYVEHDGSKYSKSYEVTNLEGICKVYRTAETVRLWNEDPAGNKAVKAKMKCTLGLYNLFDVEVTEEINISAADGEAKTFSGTWYTVSTKFKSAPFVQSIDVAETGEGTNQFEGTLSASRGFRDVTYEVVLDIYGLRIKRGHHQFCFCSKEDFRNANKIEIKFEKGGVFKGHKCGDTFDGEYTFPNGKKCEMSVKHGYIHMCSGDDVLEE
ncbi:MAG: hypothetical protein JW881_07440 [Spirochaetales bacterium]|nr:hypothetical protein [Spirochaetales bacterium]